MEPIEYRILAPDEQEHGPALYALLDTVWPGTGAECAAGRIADSHYDWCASRIALAGADVIGHVGAYRLRLRVGTARVPVAGLNLVATHAQHRGRGVMGRTLADAAHDALRAQGYALALLCNARQGVYGSAGYRSAWPEHEYRLRPAALPTEPPAAALEPFVPDGQPDLADLYNREHATVTGTAVRPTYRHTKMPGCRGTGVLWRDGAGRPAGYLVADVSRDGQTLWHSDSAGDPQQRLRALGALAREHARDCAEVRFPRLPYHAPLAAQLRRLDCREESLYRADGGWMVRVLDAEAVLRALAPELARRLAASAHAAWCGSLLVATTGATVELRVRPGRVEVFSSTGSPFAAAEAGADAVVTPDALGELALGSLALAELVDAGRLELRGAARSLAGVLFPPQLPQLGNGDL